MRKRSGKEAQRHAEERRENPRTKARRSLNLRTLRLTPIVIFIATNAALAAKPHYEITGKVVKIADGDTLTILDESKTQHKIRLAGIDAPEKGQAFGTKARENLAAKVFRRNVRVEVIDVDRYHREVGRIFHGDRFY